jgi:hypothetical protein
MSLYETDARGGFKTHLSAGTITDVSIQKGQVPIIAISTTSQPVLFQVEENAVITWVQGLRDISTGIPMELVQLVEDIDDPAGTFCHVQKGYIASVDGKGPTVTAAFKYLRPSQVVADLDLKEKWLQSEQQDREIQILRLAAHGHHVVDMHGWGYLKPAALVAFQLAFKANRNLSITMRQKGYQVKFLAMEHCNCSLSKVVFDTLILLTAEDQAQV